MSRLARKKAEVFIVLYKFLRQMIVLVTIIIHVITKNRKRARRRIGDGQRYSMIERIPDQVKHINRLVNVSDSDCMNNLRMDRNTFGRLCHIIEHLGGVTNSKYVSVEEQVALFLSILSHHKKNKVVKFDFIRSGQTVSHYIHLVLTAVLRLHSLLLVNPEPISNDCTNPRWKWFKGCFGALDGIYIQVKVPLTDKGRYRTRKGTVAVNVLDVCDRDMRFVYVLPGWEGSAADSRVLRDAVNRLHGLKVPKGYYYLCDNGYANSEGFLTPYKGVRYHLDEWGETSSRPHTFQEHFNMRHTRARNVIERAFGLLRMRWGIIRSASFYPIKVQNRLIMACFLIHNFIRNEMPNDPLEQLLDKMAHNNDDHEDMDDVVDYVESSPEWNLWRDNLAQSMFDEWRSGR